MDQKQVTMTKCKPTLREDLDKFLSTFDVKEAPTSIELFTKLEGDVYWKYMDRQSRKYKHPRPNLPNFLTSTIKKHPELVDLKDKSIETHVYEYMEHKKFIPRSGCVILNQDATKVLLMKGTACGLWKFPRGKHQPNETGMQAAARSVYKYTGLNIPESRLIEEDAIDCGMYNKALTFYIVRNVSDKTKLKMGRQWDIKDLRWISIDALYRTASLSIGTRTMQIQQHIAHCFSSSKYLKKLPEFAAIVKRNTPKQITVTKEVKNIDKITKSNEKSNDVQENKD